MPALMRRVRSASDLAFSSSVEKSARASMSSASASAVPSVFRFDALWCGGAASVGSFFSRSSAT